MRADQRQARGGDERGGIASRVFWVASLLFFASGATGLAYQLVWFKRFSHVWGSSSLAFAAVGGSFLFGLGVGAYLFGRVADRVPVPLRWYAWCELAIGAFALLIPFEVAVLVERSVAVQAAVPAQPLLRFLVQFCITALVIGPPCMLMGGTLPLLIRQLTARVGPVDEAAGWLYAINTFGAAAGCYATGFHLLPALGLLGTNDLAAAISIAIGIVSLIVSRTASRLPRTAPKLAEPHASARLASPGLYLAAMLTGCGALVLEMTWSRQLALVLGGSTYAFTATLFVVLVGIALGSLLYHRWLRPAPPSALVPTLVIGVLIAAMLAGKASLPHASLRVSTESIRALRGSPLWNGLISVGTSALLELVPAVCMGILFPLFVRMTQASGARVGAAVGDIYAWNTLGSIMGASFTAILLFPRIGTAGAMAFAVGCYVVALLAILPWRSRAGLARGGVVALAGIAGVLALAQPLDPRATNSGLYLYGDPATRSSRAVTPLFFREGASSNVFVSRDAGDTTTLRVNGKIDASDGLDMITQLGLAYFPRIFQPDARDVLVIGFGSGTTPGASLLFPDTRVIAWEIEPAVYEARAFFAGVNHRPDANPLFSIAFGDGRTGIQGSGDRFDLIISEPSNPWLAGVSNLFTREHFRAVRAHLREGGVLAQWIQTYNFTLRDYALIVRTLRSEFPHVGVILLAGGADTLLLASERPLVPSWDALERLQRVVDVTPAIRADLDRWYGGHDLRRLLLAHYAIGEAQLERLLTLDDSAALNTDLHLLLEFDAPLHLFAKTAPEETAAGGLLSVLDRAWVERLAAQIGIPTDSAGLQLALGDYHWNRVTNPTLGASLEGSGELDQAALHFERAVALDPGEVGAYRSLARARSRQKRGSDAIDAWSTVVRLTPTDAAGHAALAEELLKQRQFAEAVSHLREALRLQPELSVANHGLIWANNLAWILATHPDPDLRNGTEAVQWATQVCDADGATNPDTLDTLAASLAETGRFAEAIEVSRRMLEVASDRPEAAAMARNRIEHFQAGEPVREP